MNTSYLTSLELSKKLKEAGIKQDSRFYHCSNRILFKEELENWNPTEFYSAFLSDELGEILPHYALGDYLRNYKGRDDWSCAYGIQSTKTAKTLSEAMGEMLLYLITNQLITLK